MIPDEDVERVRESADIVQIIGEHVNLRRVGADWRGPCPFHQGTHRNFSVSPRKRMYYCFVCHAGGDVFNFLQKRLGLDWPSAVRTVAEKSGIEIREIESRREGPDPREPVWEVNAAAAEYFQRVLWEEDLGQAAREYLAKRNVSREAAERFALGFAPREIGLLRGYLNTLGYDDARLLSAGLLMQREEAEEPRPRFRGRLIFPIFDASNRLSGFGGRLIAPGEPKYLNSADSPTFTKGRLLYGLNWARHAIRRDERLLLVEGYFDVVRLVLAGVESVVAPLGTALTEDQAAMIARQTKNVFLLYDSDTAGQKATFRAGDLLLGQGVSVRVVTLPAGEDPDTFVDTHGGPALEEQIDAAVDVFDRKVQILERQGWFADLHRRRRAIDRLLPTIRATADPVTRDMYIARASEASGVDRAVLAREAGDAPGRSARARVAAASPAPPANLTQEQLRMGDRRVGERRNDAPTRSARGNGPAVERYLLRVILAHPAYLETAAEADVGPSTFTDGRYREIFETLTTLGADASPETVVRDLSPDAAQAYDEMLGEPPESLVNLEATYRDTIAALRIRELKQKNHELQRLMATARSEDEKNALLAEKNANVRMAAALRTRVT
jgi:DNA primase